VIDPPRPLRVAIVDDHPMFRLGLAAAIGEMDGIELVGEAARGDEVEQLLEDAAPDVVLLDLGLPDTSGLDVNRWIAEHHHDVCVVLLTMSEDLDAALTALRDGARGYIVKGADPNRLEHAVRTAASGDVVLDQTLAQAVTELAQVRRSSPAHPFPELTDREFDILELVAEGLDNTAIARRLVLSPKTVRNHVSNVLSKLHAPDRPGAIVLAHRHGIGV
jgi:DNA-binding NarL/FixJ family response regulator